MEILIGRYFKALELDHHDAGITREEAQKAYKDCFPSASKSGDSDGTSPVEDLFSSDKDPDGRITPLEMRKKLMSTVPPRGNFNRASKIKELIKALDGKLVDLGVVSPDLTGHLN